MDRKKGPNEVSGGWTAEDPEPCEGGARTAQRASWLKAHPETEANPTRHDHFVDAVVDGAVESVHRIQHQVGVECVEHVDTGRKARPPTLNHFSACRSRRTIAS